MKINGLHVIKLLVDFFIGITIWFVLFLIILKIFPFPNFELEWMDQILNQINEINNGATLFVTSMILMSLVSLKTMIDQKILNKSYFVSQKSSQKKNKSTSLEVAKDEI